MGTPWVSFDGKDCSGCKHLNDRGYCEFTGCVIPCTVRATIPDVKPQTNADRIRSMSDEDLAEYLLKREVSIAFQLAEIAGCTINYLPITCYGSLLHWLKKEDE